MVRFKNRYITFAIDNGKDITKPLNLTSVNLYHEIIEAVNYLHGDVGSSAIKPGLHVKYCNELTKVGIIRARHGPHKILLSAFPFIREIDESPLTFRIIFVGATLLHCYKSLLKNQEAQLNKVYSKFQSEEEKHNFESKLLPLDKTDFSDLFFKESKSSTTPD